VIIGLFPPRRSRPRRNFSRQPASPLPGGPDALTTRFWPAPPVREPGCLLYRPRNRASEARQRNSSASAGTMPAVLESRRQLPLFATFPLVPYASRPLGVSLRVRTGPGARTVRKAPGVRTVGVRFAYGRRPPCCHRSSPLRQQCQLAIPGFGLSLKRRLDGRQQRREDLPKALFYSDPLTPPGPISGG